MLENLNEQRKAAVALVEGTEYTPTKTVWEKDEHGKDIKVEEYEALLQYSGSTLSSSFKSPQQSLSNFHFDFDSKYCRVVNPFV